MIVNNNFKQIINHLIVFNICALFLIVSIVSGHRCYICGLEANVTSCDNFDPRNQKLFAKECPENFVGCSIKKNDTHTVRSCEDIKVNDCKKANHIEYCYCSTELCNGIDINFENTNENMPTDDEDANEGSGFINNVLTESTSNPSIETENSNKKSRGNGIMSPSSIILILTSIML